MENLGGKHGTLLNESCYEGVAKVKNIKMQNLRRDFENLRMKYTQSLDSFMTQVMSVVNQ